MKIILLEDVVNVGKLGEIVEVAHGYARNFLVPKGKALRATKDNTAAFEKKREEYLKKQSDNLSLAKSRQLALEGKTLTIAAKAQVDGKLFGSVGAFDIVASVASGNNIEIKKTEVELPNGPMKTLGEFDVQIKLHHDVRATIHINVVADA